jgi:hypothetical protein
MENLLSKTIFHFDQCVKLWFHLLDSSGLVGLIPTFGIANV